ncbi:hypothetical protein ABZZ16_11435 [Streptomyces sp. NPDC006386]|uniref:hypothetical protein n=1 Tax=Streptomyces sp. NPDC006386 TaxID=3156762 RepID=UPI0033AD3031
MSEGDRHGHQPPRRQSRSELARPLAPFDETAQPLGDTLVECLLPVPRACWSEPPGAAARCPRTTARRRRETSRTRKGGATATEVHLLGEFTDDGRMRRAHQLTRALTPAPADAGGQA